MSEESRVSVDTFPVEREGEIFDARDAGRPGAFCFEDVYDVETPSAPPRTFLWIVVPSLQGALAEAARLPLNAGAREWSGWHRLDGDRTPCGQRALPMHRLERRATKPRAGVCGHCAK